MVHNREKGKKQCQKTMEERYQNLQSMEKKITYGVSKVNWQLNPTRHANIIQYKENLL